MLELASSVSKLPAIGPRLSAKLARAGVFTVKDLLYYFPFRYEDLTSQKRIVETEIGETVSLKARIWQITKIRTRTGKTIIKAIINDGSSSLDCIWFNQTYLLTVLKPNLEINFSGKVGFFSGKKSLLNPAYEIVHDGISLHTERLVPIYSERSGLSSRWLRSKIYQALQLPIQKEDDLLPKEIVSEEKLLPLETALRQIHFPASFSQVRHARERFALEELLLLQIRNLILKNLTREKKREPFKIPVRKLAEFKKSLPFTLTKAQEKVSGQILNDLAKTEPMNRLLQGEVGSGKTVVSATAILTAIENKSQAAFMAPTEILAKQHFTTLNKFLGEKYKVELHTGSHKTKRADFDLIVGTHALLTEAISYRNLGLIVVDEQQRFGVKQRALLKEKGGNPHILTMTATPIPRTLALTLYGQLDISVLDEMPLGRAKVKTFLVPESKRSAAYGFINKLIKKGDQAFIICPLIELSETLTSVKSAVAEFERLSKEVFPTLKLELLHGRLKPGEKDAIITRYRQKQTHILVTTPIVEVGVDIPNATIMVIEASERFGLSSLHQLRGRVGRGKKQGYTLLFTESRDETVLARLKLMERYSDGLKLAEMDLERRGPGDLFGTLQHGQIEFDLADAANLGLIEKSRSLAENLLKDTKARKKFEELIAERYSLPAEIINN